MGNYYSVGPNEALVILYRGNYFIKEYISILPDLSQFNLTCSIKIKQRAEMDKKWNLWYLSFKFCKTIYLDIKLSFNKGKSTVSTA